MLGISGVVVTVIDVTDVATVDITDFTVAISAVASTQTKVKLLYMHYIAVHSYYHTTAKYGGHLRFVSMQNGI